MLLQSTRMQARCCGSWCASCGSLFVSARPLSLTTRLFASQRLVSFVPSVANANQMEGAPKALQAKELTAVAKLKQDGLLIRGD